MGPPKSCFVQLKCRLISLTTASVTSLRTPSDDCFNIGCGHSLQLFSKIFSSYSLSKRKKSWQKVKTHIKQKKSKRILRKIHLDYDLKFSYLKKKNFFKIVLLKNNFSFTFITLFKLLIQSVRKPKGMEQFMQGSLQK